MEEVSIILRGNRIQKLKGWGSFLKNVKLVVVDELHYYSGLFGT